MLAIGKWNPFGNTPTTPNALTPGSVGAPATASAPIINGAEYKQFGLENFGNTCYANSVLQALYFCHPFRELLTNAPDKSIPPPSSIPPTPTITPAAPQPHHSTATPSTRLRNSRKYSTPDVHARATTDPGSSTSSAPATTDSDANHPSPIPPAPPTLFSALRSLFLYIAKSTEDKGTAAPRAFIEKLRKENELFRTPMHQDAHEFFNYLLNKIVEEMEEEAKEERNHREARGDLSTSATTLPNGMAPTASTSGAVGIPTFIHRLFEGTLTSETRCLTCEKVSARDESFLDLSIDIEQNSSVTACLRQFSASEMLCQKNKFFCDACCGLQEAEKRMKIKKLPNVLALHLKRFKYQEESQKYIKLAYRVAFPMELKLFNTVDDADDPDRLYELFAVVVHIGNGPHHGHYVTIVKSRGQWVVFDDESVEFIKEADVGKYFGDSGNAGSAYVLYYQAVDIDRAALGLPELPPTPEPIVVSTSSSDSTPYPPSPALPPGLTMSTMSRQASSPVASPRAPKMRLRPSSAGPGAQPSLLSPSTPIPALTKLVPPVSTPGVDPSPVTPSPSTSKSGQLRHSPSTPLRTKALSTTEKDREEARRAIAILTSGSKASVVDQSFGALSDREEPEKSSRWPFGKRKSKSERDRAKDRLSTTSSVLSPSGPPPGLEEVSMASQLPHLPPVPPLPPPPNVVWTTAPVAKPSAAPVPGPPNGPIFAAISPVAPPAAPRARYNESAGMQAAPPTSPIAVPAPSRSSNPPEALVLSRSLPDEHNIPPQNVLTAKEGRRSSYVPVTSSQNGPVRRSSAQSQLHPHHESPQLQALVNGEPTVRTSKELRRLSAQMPPAPPPDYPLPPAPGQSGSNPHNVLRKPSRTNLLPISPEQKHVSREHVRSALGALAPQPKGASSPKSSHSSGLGQYHVSASPPPDRRYERERRISETRPTSSGSSVRGPRPMISNPPRHATGALDTPVLSPVPSSPSEVSTIIPDGSFVSRMEMGRETMRPPPQRTIQLTPSPPPMLDESEAPYMIVPPVSSTPPPRPPPRNPARGNSARVTSTPPPPPALTVQPPTPANVPPPTFVLPEPPSPQPAKAAFVPAPAPFSLLPSPSRSSSSSTASPADDPFEKNGHSQPSTDTSLASQSATKPSLPPPPPSPSLSQAPSGSKSKMSMESTATNMTRTTVRRKRPASTHTNGGSEPAAAFSTGLMIIPKPALVQQKEKEKREKKEAKEREKEAKEREKLAALELARPVSASGDDTVGKRASRKLSLTGGIFGRKEKVKDGQPPSAYGR